MIVLPKPYGLMQHHSVSLFQYFSFPSCNKYLLDVMYNFCWNDDPSMILTIPTISISIAQSFVVYPVLPATQCSGNRDVVVSCLYTGRCSTPGTRHRKTQTTLTNHFLSDWAFFSFLPLFRFDAINATVLKNHPVTKHGLRNNTWI